MNKKDAHRTHRRHRKKKLVDGEQEKRFLGFEMMLVVWKNPGVVQRGCAELRRDFCVFCVFCGLD